MLIRHLPADDLHAIGLADAPEWTWEHELARAHLDALNHIDYVLRQTHTKRRLPLPESTPRPGEDSRADARQRAAQYLIAQEEEGIGSV